MKKKTQNKNIKIRFKQIANLILYFFVQGISLNIHTKLKSQEKLGKVWF